MDDTPSAPANLQPCSLCPAFHVQPRLRGAACGHAVWWISTLLHSPTAHALNAVVVKRVIDSAGGKGGSRLRDAVKKSVTEKAC